MSATGQDISKETMKAKKKFNKHLDKLFDEYDDLPLKKDISILDAIRSTGYKAETPAEVMMEWHPLDQMFAEDPHKISLYHGYLTETEKYGCDDKMVRD